MEKILAVAIFVVMFALIIWDRFPRQWVTLGRELWCWYWCSACACMTEGPSGRR